MQEKAWMQEKAIEVLLQRNASSLRLPKECAAELNRQSGELQNKIKLNNGHVVLL